MVTDVYCHPVSKDETTVKPAGARSLCRQQHCRRQGALKENFEFLAKLGISSKWKPMVIECICGYVPRCSGPTESGEVSRPCRPS